MPGHQISFPPLTRVVRGLLAKLHGQGFDGDRNLYETCGYPEAIVANDYIQQYLRGDIAARIIDAFPAATWREAPTITAAGEDADGPFAQQIERLGEEFGLWNTLSRLDKLTSLGHYGVLLFGVAGGQPAHEPLTGRDHKLLYLSPHGERSADITQWNADAASKRFAKPETYRVTVGVNWVGTGGAERSLNVHHSRVIHVTEGALDDKAIGIPRLERIYNRLWDLDKLLGGSAEVFWQNAANVRAWKADSDVEWQPEEQADMEAQLEALAHKLRRDVRLRGVEPQTLAGTVADPKSHIDAQLDIIAGAIGIPKRILIGSERGELSSEQDENNWAARIAERRDSHATTEIIRPAIDKLIAIGYISEPAGGRYEVEWPESDTLGEQARSQIAKGKAEAVQAYISVPGAEIVVPVPEFRRWLGEEEVSEFELSDEAIDGELAEDDTLVQDEFGEVAGAAGADSAQDTALNGAQIAAIKDIVQAVGMKEMAPESAVRLLMLGFPLIDEPVAREIIRPMEAFTPAEVERTAEAIDQMGAPTVNRIRRLVRRDRAA